MLDLEAYFLLPGGEYRNGRKGLVLRVLYQGCTEFKLLGLHKVFDRCAWVLLGIAESVYFTPFLTSQQDHCNHQYTLPNQTPLHHACAPLTSMEPHTSLPSNDSGSSEFVFGILIWGYSLGLGQLALAEREILLCWKWTAGRFLAFR